ncbi:FHA domain protein [Ancylostoma caninum]|uniref:FHA domain protein n=1 Tax=Ancylostoma caninum TaxID=29170 RepID=A0A368G483_ANCCA|nr:FHA domain protein [Ancylostoma caninum]
MRELREENERLQQQLKGGGGGSNEEVESLRRQLEQNQKEMAELEKTWQEKIAEEAAKHNASAERMAIMKQRQEIPHLWNLNEDPALTDVIVHFLPPGEITIGNKTADPAPMVQLNGLSILPQHAVVQNTKNKKLVLTACEGAEVLVNGKKITKPKELSQNDRVLFGGNHLYVFNNPTKKGARKDITYEEAQKEIAKGAGIGIADDGGKSKGELSSSTYIPAPHLSVIPADLILEEELISTMPLVYRANAMAVELKRNVKFELVLVSPEMRGLQEGLTEIWVSVHNLTEDTRFMWEKARFMNRYYGMQEMYENKQDGEEWNMPKARNSHLSRQSLIYKYSLISKLSHFNQLFAFFFGSTICELDRDPFYEAPDSKSLLGSAIIFLQPLAYLMDSEETYPIVDFTGEELGELSVLLTPCNSSGKEMLGEYVDDPKEIIGKNYGFTVKIQSARGLPRRIDKSSCKYRFFDGKEVDTALVAGNNPSYIHEQTFQYKSVSSELADYLLNSNLWITLWGTQKARQYQASRRTPSASSEGKRPSRKKKVAKPSKPVEGENGADKSGAEPKTPKKKSSSKTRRPKRATSASPQ